VIVTIPADMPCQTYIITTHGDDNNHSTSNPAIPLMTINYAILVHTLITAAEHAGVAGNDYNSYQLGQ